MEFETKAFLVSSNEENSKTGITKIVCKLQNVQSYYYFLLLFSSFQYCMQFGFKPIWVFNDRCKHIQGILLYV